MGRCKNRFPLIRKDGRPNGLSAVIYGGAPALSRQKVLCPEQGCNTMLPRPFFDKTDVGKARQACKSGDFAIGKIRPKKGSKGHAMPAVTVRMWTFGVTPPILDSCRPECGARSSKSDPHRRLRSVIQHAFMRNSHQSIRQMNLHF